MPVMAAKGGATGRGGGAVHMATALAGARQCSGPQRQAAGEQGVTLPGIHASRGAMRARRPSIKNRFYSRDSGGARARHLPVCTNSCEPFGD